MRVKKRWSAAGGTGMVAVAVSTIVVLGLPSAVAQASSDNSTRVAVPAGVSPAAVPGAKVFGNVDPSTPETVAFVLDIQHEATLEAAVEHGIAPSSFLSVGQFASGYGQSLANVYKLQSYLSGYGISSNAYADDIDVVANGTAGQFDKALGVQEQQYHVPAQAGSNGQAGVPAQNVYGTSQQPLLPEDIASYVTAVLGLSNYGPFASDAVHATYAHGGTAGSKSAAVSPAGYSVGTCLVLTGLPTACHTPTDFATEYGLNPVYSSGNGRGRTIGIVTLAALDPGAPQYFWQNVAGLRSTGRTLTTVDVDGGPGAPSDAAGTGETDLDVEQSGGVAPGANIIVYQAPNTDFGFVDAFMMAASKNVADDVSASWAESETYLIASVLSGAESQGYAAAFNEAFLEMAVQGQSAFNASGDWGAYTASVDFGSTNLSVANPSDSSFITSAGGTTLPWSGTLTGPDGSAPVSVAKQRSWGWDYLWQPVATITGEPLAESAESQVIGGGGGFSVFGQTPTYQQGVTGTGTYNAVEYLTPTDYQSEDGITVPTAWNFNPTPKVTSGKGSGRAVPDLSTNADPYSGYLLYEPSAAGVDEPVLQGGWGGTSFVAPQLNGAAAVIDSALGHRVGLWNPAIYAAASGPHSPFTPLQSAGTSNDNIYYTGQPGDVYNQASGLGVPNLAGVAKALG